MEAREIIDAFRGQLNRVEAGGSSSVQIEALRSYLTALERDAAMSSEHRGREHEGFLAQLTARHEYSIAMLEAELEAGKTALQALIIINGGAVIALLGVLGNLAGKPEGSLLARYLSLPLLEFGVAVLLGALGFAARYLSQTFYSELENEGAKSQIWGHRFRYAAILLAIGGYVLFGLAIANSYNAVLWSFEKL